MARVTLAGFNVPALITAAGALSNGQQKAKYCADVATLLGANPIFEITVAGVVKYRTTVAGSLTSSSAGVLIPAQLVEPPTVNLADALTGTDCLILIRNATNASVYAQVPVRVGGGADYVTASLALDGTRRVRTNAFRLTAPVTLDVTGGTAGSISYAKQNLIDDMTLANQNNWGIAQAPATQVGTTVYAKIGVGINRADGDSTTLNRYLNDATLPLTDGSTQTLTDTTPVQLRGWVIAGRASGATARSFNSRLQLRGFKLFARLRSSTWSTLVTVENAVIGAQWHADFAFQGSELLIPIETGAAVYQARQEPSANGNGQSVGSIGAGNWGTALNPARGVNLVRFEDFAFHTYALSHSDTRKWWVDNVRGVVQVCEARLIVHDPSQPDDRANANLMIWSGADLRINGVDVLGGHAVGRIKLVPADGLWRTFSFSSIPTTILNTTPPPGWS